MVTMPLESQKESTEQFLFVGQGTVGRAFSKRRQCFAADVIAFSKTRSNVKEADSPISNHKNEKNHKIEKSAGDAVNDEDSEIHSNSLAKGLEDHENLLEPVSLTLKKPI